MGRIGNEVPIEELDLGVGAYNVLKRMDVHTVGALLGVTRDDLDRWARANPNAVYNRTAVAVDVAAAQARVGMSRWGGGAA